MQEQVLNLLATRKGHFLLESGHHGDLWLDLEFLFLQPKLVAPIAAELASRFSRLNVEVICGPLVEGAFVGLMVALQLGVPFAYSERYACPSEDGLFSTRYRIPDPLRASLQNKRVAIINDVINAGSAMRGTFDDLESCASTVVAIGALLILGTAASEFAYARNVPLESIAALPNRLWVPATCPLCSSGVPLEDVAGFRTVLA